MHVEGNLKHGRDNYGFPRPSIMLNTHDPITLNYYKNTIRSNYKSKIKLTTKLFLTYAKL